MNDDTADLEFTLRQELHRKVVAHDADRAEEMIEVATRRTPAVRHVNLASLSAAAAVLVIAGGAALFARHPVGGAPASTGAAPTAPAATSSSAATESSHNVCLPIGKNACGAMLNALDGRCSYEIAAPAGSASPTTAEPTNGRLIVITEGHIGGKVRTLRVLQRCPKSAESGSLEIVTTAPPATGPSGTHTPDLTSVGPSAGYSAVSTTPAPDITPTN